MIIGIIADTHDNLPPTKKAVELFNSRGIDYMIHAGDFTSPFTVKLFKELRCKYVGIFGNNDGDRLLLQERSEGNIQNAPLILTLNPPSPPFSKGGRGGFSDEKKIIVIHEHHIVNALADSGHFDLVIYGHTHEPLIKKVKDTLLINPGEVCGWLYGKSTAALVDLNRMEAEIVEL